MITYNSIAFQVITHLLLNMYMINTPTCFY